MLLSDNTRAVGLDTLTERILTMLADAGKTKQRHVIKNLSI